MNNKAVASDERYVRVFRGTNELKSGDVYQPSESLTISISDTKPQYVYEVSEGGAKFEKGGCEGRRIADKPKVTLVMPAKGAASTSEFEIVTAWATGHEAVKISLPFRLISAESTTQREALVTKSKSKLSVMSRKKLDQDTEEEPEDHHAGRVDEHHHDERHLHEDHEHEEAEHHHDERHLHEDREHEENQYHHDQLNHDIQHKHDQWHLGQEEEEDYHDEQYRLHQHDHEEPEYRHDRVIPHHEIEARLHDPFNHAHDPFSHHGHDVFADEPFAHHPHDHDHNHGDLAHLDQHHQHQQPETAHIPNEHLPIPHDALPHHLLQQPGLLHKHILSQQQQLHNMFTHTSEEQLVPAPTEEGNKEDVESAAYRHHRKILRFPLRPILQHIPSYLFFLLIYL